MANPPYTKRITPKDNPSAATPMPLAIISASPIRLSAERHIDFRYKNDYELIIIE
jgi:hypothetical protein